jgi:hypothetical protein
MADEKYAIRHSIHNVELSDEQWRSIEQVIRNALKHGPKTNDDSQCCMEECEIASQRCDEDGVSALL